MSVRLVKPTVHSGSVQRWSRAYDDLGVLAEPAELIHEGVSLRPPPPVSRSVLDVAAAYQRAARHRGASPGRPTVVLAAGTARVSWHDDGPAERLVYVVRWDNLMFPSSGPARRDGRPSGSVIGTRTVIVDSGTGKVLLDIEASRSGGEPGTQPAEPGGHSAR
jgi:hypothetical protein